jgi:hypothetical protein
MDFTQEQQTFIANITRNLAELGTSTREEQTQEQQQEYAHPNMLGTYLAPATMQARILRE